MVKRVIKWGSFLLIELILSFQSPRLPIRLERKIGYDYPTSKWKYHVGAQVNTAVAYITDINCSFPRNATFELLVILESSEMGNVTTMPQPIATNKCHQRRRADKKRYF
jgi:hypothetical protein